MTNVKISVNGMGAGSVELDGRDVSAGVAGLALTTRANEPAELALILSVTTVVVEADASIKLPEPVVHLLVAAGWTRPPNLAGQCDHVWRDDGLGAANCMRCGEVE